VNAFLDALGRKLAEQWFSLLVLPGVLWAATALLAARLGQNRALDLRALHDDVDRQVAKAPGTGTLVLLLAGLLITGAAVGLAATGLGALVRRAWVVRGRWRPARWLVGWRQR
jgi:hypothetical protein